MKRKYLLLALLFSVFLLIWLGKDLHPLDVRIYYSSYEALGYFSLLSSNQLYFLRIYNVVDLLFFIPIYSLLLGQFIPAISSSSRLIFLILLSALIAADLVETLSQIIASFEIGWLIIPSILSIATPSKWLLLGLYLLSCLLFLAFNRSEQ